MKEGRSVQIAFAKHIVGTSRLELLTSRTPYARSTN
jgi:hypothetical protein